MKKLFAVFAMVFAVALFVGCAEEPVEEEMVTPEAEETLESSPTDGALVPETGPDVTDTTMTDTSMTDTTMTDTMMQDTAMTDTEMQN